MELRKIVSVTSMTKHNLVLYRNDLGIVKLPIKKQLSCKDNMISIKVTTGNAPNKLEATNNIVEHAYAISEKIVRNKEPLFKLIYSQGKPISHQLL